MIGIDRPYSRAGRVHQARIEVGSGKRALYVLYHPTHTNADCLLSARE